MSELISVLQNLPHIQCRIVTHFQNLKTNLLYFQFLKPLTNGGNRVVDSILINSAFGSSKCP